MNDQFTRETFKHGLRKLLDPSGHFSICRDPIAEAADALAGVVQRREARVGQAEFLQLVK